MKLRDLENSWVFWTLFIIGFIVVSILILAPKSSTSFTVIPAGFLLFPLGLLLLVPVVYVLVASSTPTIYIYIAAYYGLLAGLVFKMVRDKKFNTGYVIATLAILLLTFYGCARGG